MMGSGKTQERIAVETTIHRIKPENVDAFSFFVRFVREFGEENGFLLDSSSSASRAVASSIVGLFPVVSVRAKGNLLHVDGLYGLERHIQSPRETEIRGDLPALLDAVMGQFAVQEGLAPYAFGYLGFFGYDAIRYFEAIPETTADDREIDDVHLQIHRIVVHATPEEVTVYLHDLPGVDGAVGWDTVLRLLGESHAPPVFAGYDPALLEVAEDVEFDRYVERVKRVKEYILAGDIFQCQVAKRMRIKGHFDTLQIYGRLRVMNPSPYMFYARYGGYLLFGASPEVQVRVDDGVAQMKPIAGTSKGKGATPEENARLIEQLVGDEKERAEHVMLVDLCRNDLGRIAVPGTVEVKELLKVEEYSHVFHLVSLVTARVRPGVSPFEVFLATFPAGTLTGAPKVRAMEIIDEMEDFHRGPYGGVIGMMDCFGNVNTAIVIRTVVCQGDTAYLQAAAGVVADSVPEQEWMECNHKLGALRATIL